MSHRCCMLQKQKILVNYKSKHKVYWLSFLSVLIGLVWYAWPINLKSEYCLVLSIISNLLSSVGDVFSYIFSPWPGPHSSLVTVWLMLWNAGGRTNDKEKFVNWNTKSMSFILTRTDKWGNGIEPYQMFVPKSFVYQLLSSPPRNICYLRISVGWKGGAN